MFTFSEYKEIGFGLTQMGLTSLKIKIYLVPILFYFICSTVLYLICLLFFASRNKWKILNRVYLKLRALLFQVQFSGGFLFCFQPWILFSLQQFNFNSTSDNFSSIITFSMAAIAIIFPVSSFVFPSAAIMRAWCAALHTLVGFENNR